MGILMFPLSRPFGFLLLYFYIGEEMYKMTDKTN